eukprot:Em0025g132a
MHVDTEIWTGSGFQCPATASSAANTLTLSQQKGASLNTVPGSCGNLSAVMTNISGTCYTSVLTIPTPQYFNGTTVTCRDGNFGTLIGNDTLNIKLASAPSAPTIISLISTYSDQLTVTWTSVPTATSYNVSINDSVNTLVPIPSTGAPQYTFTGLTSNTVYTVSVVAINCAGSSSPATITGRTVLFPQGSFKYEAALSQWTGSGFQCPATASSAANILTLSQQTGASLNAVPGSCGNLSAVMTNISGTCYTSVLTIPTPQYFNGTTVTCKDSNFGILIGNDTLRIQLASAPSAPTITSLISTYSNQLTVNWTSVSAATSYNVSINDSVNTLVPIPSTGAPQYTFTGLTNNTVYSVSVVAINCAGSSSPATITGRTALPTTSTPTRSVRAIQSIIVIFDHVNAERGLFSNVGVIIGQARTISCLDT